MSVTTHKLRVVEARRIKHPVLDKVEKHYFLVRAKEMPTGIRTDANARDPEGLNRRVYRDVQESLFGRGGVPAGTFDLLNKGIVCLAESVQRLGDDHTYEITIKDGQGIVDGAHTYKIVCDAQNDADLPNEQCVEFQVRTGVESELITDIARGLNTGIQVRPHSLDNLEGKYDWIKDDLRKEKYFSRIAWRESDDGDYDVRDLISVMEALNVIDFRTTVELILLLRTKVVVAGEEVLRRCRPRKRRFEQIYVLSIAPNPPRRARAMGYDSA